jgi:hypothetical protein
MTLFLQPFFLYLSGHVIFTTTGSHARPEPEWNVEESHGSGAA